MNTSSSKMTAPMQRRGYTFFLLLLLLLLFLLDSYMLDSYMLDTTATFFWGAQLNQHWFCRRTEQKSCKQPDAKQFGECQPYSDGNINSLKEPRLNAA